MMNKSKSARMDELAPRVDALQQLVPPNCATRIQTLEATVEKLQNDLSTMLIAFHKLESAQAAAVATAAAQAKQAPAAPPALPTPPALPKPATENGLPADVTCKMDPTSGRNYYVDTKSGKSFWVLDQLLAARPAQGAVMPVPTNADDLSRYPNAVRDQLQQLQEKKKRAAEEYGAELERKYRLQRDALLKSPGVGDSPHLQKASSAASANVGMLDMSSPLSFVIFGATGDLAKKKLFPALAALMQNRLIPEQVNVVGYARSQMTTQALLDKQGINVKGTKAQKDTFFSRCSYFQGGYDNPDDFARLHETLLEYEKDGKGNRVFFLSVPPSIFGVVCELLKQKCESKTGYTHLIIEKPFGRDSATFEELNSVTSALYKEAQLFRIDHYLGKEVVLNLATLRFGNQILEPLWNKEHISSVQIIWKEDLGTGGRGGYFDKFGIIRDIIQNHLLQVFMFLTMEAPKSLTASDLAAEKVNLLKSVKTLEATDTHLGQFTGNTFQRFDKTAYEPGYLEDPTVPEGSTCATYAMLHLQVDNERWKGVPFLVSAGKGLDERLCEVRVKFKANAVNAVVGTSLQTNELVMRIQPDEAIYFKLNVKRPGLEYQPVPGVLDLSYKTAFADAYQGDAYERMFLNAARGDNSLFVGTSELVEAWRIFTPLLHDLDNRKPKPIFYKFGSRGPSGMDQFATKRNVELSCSWEEFLYHNAGDMEKMQAIFESLTGKTIMDSACTLDERGIRALASQFYDGRPPTDKLINKIFATLDVDNSGAVTWDEFRAGAQLLLSNFGDDEKDQKAENMDHISNWVFG